MTSDRKSGRPDALEARELAAEQDRAECARYRRSATPRADAQDRLLRLAVASAQVGSWEWDVEQDYVECSELVAPLYGLPPGQPSDLAAFIALCHPDDRAQVELAIQQGLHGAEDRYTVEHRVIWPDHSLHWLEVRGHVYRDQSGRATRMAGVVVDVTRRKEAETNLVAERQRSEDALRRAEEKFLSVFREAPVAISITRVADGLLLDVNRQFEHLFGYIRAEALGRTTVQLGMWPDPEERARLADHLAFDGAERAVREVTLRTKDGRLVPIVTSVHPLNHEGELYMLSAFADLTERRRGEAERRELELKLQLAQRLEAVGRLAAGVAHDFNNVLSAITMNSDLLREALLPAHPGLEDVLEIRKAADRAVRLVRQLLAFSRQQVMEPRVVDLNELLANIELMLRRLAGDSVLMSARYGKELWAVKADPSQMEQVLVNLTVNARDAMPQGGMLSVETRNVSFPEGHTANHEPLAAGDYVTISVTDTGMGMDKDTRARMFEPFFTTKEQGHGIGLGLSTVYGIVRQSGGVIDVFSELGSGTRLTVLLPRAHGPLSLPPSVGIPESSGGSETILLVEEDAAVRQATRKILVGLGYRVLEAAHPSDAVELVRVYVGPIDLLISDLATPGMSGRELARALSELRPALRVLHMSGYADDLALREGMLAAGCAFIQKPFANATLAGKVRSLLDGD